MMTTPNLSVPIAALFPPGVVAAELRGPGDERLLLPEEASFLGRAVPKRRGEFAAGRCCARRAMAEFAIADIPLKMAPDRQPVWPAGIVGSITHTRDFCAAVVGSRERLAALGVDSEVVGDVGSEILPRICVSAEAGWIASLPDQDRAAAATLVFAAKEAFYKCQYPLVGERLGFKDARVEATWGASGGEFLVHVMRPIALAAHAALPLQGRFLLHDGLVTAGVGLAAFAAQ
jgi:4'-phosphopantetheinyl transferase EntD